MNIQDQLERILRELLVTVSRAPVSEIDPEYVMVHKKEAQRQLAALRDIVAVMMEQYEVTEQSRLHAELEVEKQRTEIIRSANHQAEDIYAASVIYTDDALGRIQDIIDEAEKSTRKILNRVGREMEAERRRIRSNQVELMTQLEDMNDTAKYMRLIDERNKELAKAKAEKLEKGKPKPTERAEEGGTGYGGASPVIKIDEEYFEKAGLTPDGLPKEMEEGILKEAEQEIAEELAPDEPHQFEKPVIKVNPEYFEKKRRKPRKRPAKKKGKKSPKKKKNIQGGFCSERNHKQKEKGAQR